MSEISMGSPERNPRLERRKGHVAAEENLVAVAGGALFPDPVLAVEHQQCARCRAKVVRACYP